MKLKLLLTSLILSATFYNVAGQNKVMVAAHRGDWRNAPENSLLAFKYAADMGVDIVELDLGKTKDGVIIIMHDQTIDRTTNGKGKPSDYTFEEIRKFGLRNGLGRVTPNVIPTLEEVMLALRGKSVMVNLDKSYPYYEEAYAILQKTGTLKQAIFKAEVTYAELKQRYPDLVDKITYMPIVNLSKPEAKQIINDYLANMKPFAFEMNFGKDTSAILANNKFITTKGARVWLNSLWASLNAGHDDDTAIEGGNFKDSWDWLIAHGATVIQTDRPKEMIKYLKARKLYK
ncbi:glycerophosphodiester phosphodiesterase family protein [Mucilaginibacter pallidiroseus]|uniref:Glycerophosphodiester phosphodiesterase family protein n=1 Tax=Mucilaginibacter pallidiroseus TaxID=2599295 RepID=A0A563TZF2_9SPHI|nr:glycerophosphodiester phosphodiesterase family protein [Mucilaginibacter pallidiroseus]TWR24737.1 glycerophosphodiester phosphodiesterase family protein [Mucilaginibacter pallidiroseus]